MEEARELRQEYIEMTKKLIAQVKMEPDLKAINPELIRTITECLKTAYDRR